VGEYDILLGLDIAADDAAIRAALETGDGIASWWSNRSTLADGTDGADGRRLEVSFPDVPRPFELAARETAGRIEWATGGFPPPWAGTTVTFDLSPNPDGPGTRLRFGHRGFAADDSQIPTVAFTWAQILLRLKGYAETGRRQPFFDF
jgi:hypothetical protein